MERSNNCNAFEVFVKKGEMMKNTIPFICALILLSTVVMYGQQSWIRTYGGSEWDFGHSVRQTQDDGFIITGRTMSFGAGGEDLYIVKINALGDTVWTKAYGGQNSDGGCCIQITSDGGYIIAGRTLSFGAGSIDIWLVRTDSFGDTLWTKTFGTANEEWGYYVEQTTDGGYIIVGYKMFSPSEGDVYLIKTDSLGNEQWSKTYGGANYDEARSVRQTPDGGYIICGTDNFNVSNSELYLIKTDSLGNEDWSKTYGGPLMDYGLDVSLTSDGGYIVVGKKTLADSGGQAWIIKVDATGDTVWTRVFGGLASDYAHSVLETSEGDYVFAGGISDEQTGFSDGYLVKTDSSGNNVWTKVYGDSSSDNFLSVEQTADGGYICIGSMYLDGYDVFAVKTDANGNVGVGEERKGKQAIRKHTYNVQPDPFISYATVLDFEQEWFLIYDVQGRLVGIHRGNCIGKDLCAGVYFLRLKDCNEIQKKIVKIK